MRPKKVASEPVMSDATILATVENLINLAMGPPQKNTIDYKMLQTVLHILARQMRLLETQVELRISETEPQDKHGHKKKRGASSGSSPEHSPTARHKGKGKRGKDDVKVDQDIEEAQKALREKEKVDANAKETVPKSAKDQAAKDKDKEKETKSAKAQTRKGKKGASSDTNIVVTEMERDNEKVLVVEKGPTTRSDSRTRVGSIEVVTASQFELLQSMVSELLQRAGPPPASALPDNEQLRTDLARGSASLTDAMEAMQLQARVQAAERAIDRMAGLLTQLAGADGLAGMDMETLEHAVRDRKSVAVSPSSRLDTGKSGVSTRPSDMSAASRAFAVTHPEMESAILTLKEDLMKSVSAMISKAVATADTAALTARAVAEKLDVCVKLNGRVTWLHTLVTDHTDQLGGFHTGLTTQMQSFQEQMQQMRSDLGGGLEQLETANTNAETAAVLELTERYEGLSQDLEQAVAAHQMLANSQGQLTDHLRGLLDAVEMLREQKADLDEVLDGLRDKADSSRLADLLTEQQFSAARAELQRRIDLCHDKFGRQEAVWMAALKDLSYIAEGKAELAQLMAAKDDSERRLNMLQEHLKALALQLGEPKAAILTRLLSRDGACGACMVKALMDPEDPSHGRPPPLPALRPPPAQPCVPAAEPYVLAGEPCVPPHVPELKEHMCQRWVGGSHTLLTHVSRQHATPLPLTQRAPPVRKYADYGSDGRLYMLEAELQPCAECNERTQHDHTQDSGSGDHVVTTVTVPEKPTNDD